MKKLFSATISRQIKTKMQSVPFEWNAQPLYYLIMLLGTFLFTACKKNAINEKKNEEQTINSKGIKTDTDFHTNNTTLDPQTLLELQQAHAATARYHNIANAIADGYENPPFLRMEFMGYHFKKTSLIEDGKFDLTTPEILVYNKKANGKFELVAIEYAVPIDPQHIDTPPAGFTGDGDEWDFNTLNSGLWTLHAWVWQNNPDGVFEMFNPEVIVR